ncbi:MULTISPECIES: LysR family transcriptional regulator [Kocuria]|uniref:LysR family transcriptional regulator n=1 Tax=Kocuria subflava TaxID=1736139 RepID=A0A846TT43_9MICC|nr:MULTISPECIES: LysR family transcriptional regulator [Kocuria]NKE08437.1 LysR family transcriptional regulator [Kocuria subflava]
MAHIDLALVRTFNAIYETRSVTEASVLLRVTQPSVSYALARLRKQLGNPLFARTPHGMEPTMRADELYTVFSRAVSQIDAVADPTYDPQSSERIFRLSLSDLGELTFLPAIGALLAQRAPTVGLEVEPMDIDTVADRIRRGQMDAAVASSHIAGLKCRTLVTGDRYVCLQPRTTAENGSVISVEDFIRARHMVVEETAGHDRVERAIQSSALRRRPTLRIPHYATLPRLLVQGEFLVVLPLRIAREFAADGQLEIRELPIDVPRFEVSIYWQPRIPANAGTAWLVDLIAEACMAAPPTRHDGRNG